MNCKQTSSWRIKRSNLCNPSEYIIRYEQDVKKCKVDLIREREQKENRKRENEKKRKL